MSKAYGLGSKIQSSSEASSVSPQQSRPFLKQIQTFLGEAIPLGIGCFLLGAVTYLIAGDNKIALALGGGLFSTILSWNYPRQALWFFFIYMPFSGTVTYWIAGGNALFQLAKDAFYVPGLLSIFFGLKKSKEVFLRPKSILPALWLLAFFCVLSILFVSVPRQFTEGGLLFFQGLLGAKVFIGYIPLIFVMQLLIRTKRELLFLNRMHVILAIVCCSLCLLQYIFLLTGRCAGTDHLTGNDLFEATIEAKCLVGGALVFSPSQDVIRLPGTFVAPWQWGWFLIGNAYLTFAVAFSDPSFLWRLIGFAGMGSVTMAAVICGQRIALALVPMSFFVLLVLTGQLFNLKRLIPILVGAIGAGLFSWIQYQDVILERIASFQSRWAASPADDMIAGQVEFVWKSMKGFSAALGHGLGSATNSARIFGNTWLIETWFPKVLFEAGLVGLAIFLGFVTVLTIVTFFTYRSVADRNLKDMGASYWVFILFISYQTYYYPLDVDPVAVYYWMMVGTILRLPEIDRQLTAESLALDTAATPSIAHQSLLESKLQSNLKPKIKTNRFAPMRQMKPMENGLDNHD